MYFIFSYVYMYISVWGPVPLSASAQGGRSLWRWSDGHLWATWPGCWVWNSGPVKEQHAFKHWAISLVPSLCMYLLVSLFLGPFPSLCILSFLSTLPDLQCRPKFRFLLPLPSFFFTAFLFFFSSFLARLCVTPSSTRCYCSVTGFLLSWKSVPRSLSGELKC